MSNTTDKKQKNVCFFVVIFLIFFSLNRTRLVEQLESNPILWEF